MPLPRVVTTPQARALGVSAARERTHLRHGTWRRVASGILLTRPDEPTRDDWIHVGALLGGASAALSGWDAVRLRGLGPTQSPDPRVLILLGPGRRTRTVGGVHLRPSRRPVQTSVLALDEFGERRIRLASPARSIADTALVTQRDADVRAMATAAVQRGLCTADDLLAELATSPRAGSAVLRLALGDVTAQAHSVAEADAIRWLRRAGVSGFFANAPIRDSEGRVRFRADLLWPALRAIVEIDSREFHFTEHGWKETMRRHNALTALGYRVAHHPPSAIREGGLAWAHEVQDWLASCAA